MAQYTDTVLNVINSQICSHRMSSVTMVSGNSICSQKVETFRNGQVVGDIPLTAEDMNKISLQIIRFLSRFLGAKITEEF